MDAVNWLLLTDGFITHAVPVGDAILHEVDLSLETCVCVCVPQVRPLYCEHGELEGFVLYHSRLAPESEGHERG